jgi:ABC-type lipoprotein export system ATPase subunit
LSFKDCGAFSCLRLHPVYTAFKVHLTSVLKLMSDLNEKEKTTFIFSTHDPDVLRYARDIVKIKDGIIVGQG